MLQQHVLLGHDPFRLFPQQLFVHEKLLHLEAYLGIFVRVERSDARFRRTEGFAAEALFFVLVKKYVVRHQYLSSVGNQDVWLRDTLIDQRAYLLHEKRNIESDTVSQDIGDVLVENA